MSLSAAATAAVSGLSHGAAGLGRSPVPARAACRSSRRGPGLRPVIVTAGTVTVTVQPAAPATGRVGCPAGDDGATARVSWFLESL